MAMLFDHQPLDDFAIDDIYSNNVEHSFWEAEIDKFNLGSLLPTPPLSPDQQLGLKQEIETQDNWNTDAEVECYLSYHQQNNIIINDKIWSDDKVFTPTELSADSFLKLKTPTLEDNSTTLMISNHIRPITPPTPIKIELNSPIKIESPTKPTLRRFPKFQLGQLPPLVRIKDEPRSPPPSSSVMFSPPPIKSSKEAGFFSRKSNFSSVTPKDEPVDHVPAQPDIRVRISVKDETSFEITENNHSELVIKDRVCSRQQRQKRTKQVRGKMESEIKPEEDNKDDLQVPERRISGRLDSLSTTGSDEDEAIDEVYLKRKLAEICDIADDGGALSPKRRLVQCAHQNALAEAAAAKLSLEQLRNLSAAHSHPEDDVCTESCTKRFAHNVLERKRRNDLKVSYQQLQAEVPTICGGDRVAKVVILKESAEHIKKTEAEGQALREELRELRAHQRQLISKFRQLFKLTQQNNVSGTK